MFRFQPSRGRNSATNSSPYSCERRNVDAHNMIHGSHSSSNKRRSKTTKRLYHAMCKASAVNKDIIIYEKCVDKQITNAPLYEVGVYF